MTMKNASTKNMSRFVPRRRRRAFTMMELMVSITILVAVILAVNISFNGASKAVGTSQATMDLMANVRATQQMIERDLRGLDKNSFLVIRSRMNDTTQGDASYRFDQISFISLGQFQNPTGADNNASPFTDSSIAGAAHIWIGQLIMEKNVVPDPSYNVNGQPGPKQQVGAALSQLPTGAWDDASGRHIQESEFVLGRHATALFPGPADGSNHISPGGNNPIMAYSTLDGRPGASTINGAEGTAAHISSSRYAVDAQTPSQIMQSIASARFGGATDPEADFLTYRFRALQTVYDTEVTTNPFVNGTYRMSPVVMSGVSSLKIEWTDGAIYGDPAVTSIPDPHNPTGALTGQVKWYGPTLPAGGGTIFDTTTLNRNFGTDNSSVDGVTERLYGSPTATPTNGDHYSATFSYFNRNKWPKALRFTYHVYGDRLGGRDFVQVVNLP